MWNKLEYLKATTMGDAFKLLAKSGASAVVYAGGSDILVEMRNGGSKPKTLVDIKGIKELSTLSYKNKLLSIGANVTVSALMNSRPAQNIFSIFKEAGEVFGSPQIRNRATIGGNVCWASPSADIPPCLLVLGAKVVAANRRGKRKIPIEKFFRGRQQHVLKKGELVTLIEVTAPAPKTGSAFIKQRRTNFDIALVNAAAALRLNRGKVSDVRIAMGGVAPIPMRALKAEQTLKGQVPSKELLAEVGAVAASETKPIGDVRASAEYRRHLSGVLVARVVENALRKIGGASWK